MTNNKIVCRMSGGLGNQLFELSYALNLLNMSNIETIHLDGSSLQLYKSKHINYIKHFFDFSGAPFIIEEKKYFITKLRLPRFFALKKENWPLISDKNSDKIWRLNSSCILDGYFIWALNQNDFTAICRTLEKYLRDPLKINILDDSCVMHIRGGDFLELGWNKHTPDTYYLNAMRVMSENYNIKYFIAITDDMKYAKELLCKCKYDYEIRSNDMKTDFYTIANSKYKIIGGSSFAIWASALGYNGKDGKLIAPPCKVLLPNQMEG